jgi:hypothetical protein
MFLAEIFDYERPSFPGRLWVVFALEVFDVLDPLKP